LTTRIVDTHDHAGIVKVRRLLLAVVGVILKLKVAELRIYCDVAGIVIGYAGVEAIVGLIDLTRFNPDLREWIVAVL